MANFTGNIALGKITVPTPGSPVPLQAEAPTGLASQTCHGYIIQALSTNTGKIYIGDSTLNKATLAGVFCVLAIPTNNLFPSFSSSVGNAAGPAFNLATIYIDADNAGEGVVASAVVT